jgi:hypothetical protein
VLEWSPEELHNMAKDLFDGCGTFCKYCAVPVESRRRRVFGNPRESVRFRCKLCGRFGTFEPALVDVDMRPWTLLEKRTVADAHFSGRLVRCPVDGAIMAVLESKAIRIGPPYFTVYCPWCGGGFASPELAV